MTLLQDFENRLAAAVTAVLGEPAACPVTPAADLRFGDLADLVGAFGR